VSLRSFDVETTSAKGTRRLGARLARVVQPGDLVLLSGDLGAGKTTFVQGFASALGVEEQVTSPTFTILRPYACTASEALDRRIRTLLHADVYRLEHTGEMLDVAIHELIEDGAVALVEWGERAAPVIGREALVVVLNHADGDDDRMVTIEVPPSWEGRAGLADLAGSPAGS
jgi:tRNA threonylcarbamoyladenosine biosynthesis protein TsaE